MAGLVKFAFAAFLVVVMIMLGTAAAEEVKAAAPSPIMEAGAASMTFFPSLFAALIASFFPFLASLLFN